MRYIHEPTGAYPLSEGAIKQHIRKETPNVSFARPFVPPEGFARVIETPEPEHDPMYERAKELPPEKIDGVWTQRWVVRPATREEVLAAIPNSVPMYKGRAALLNMVHEGSDLFDVVQERINGSSDKIMQNEWEYQTEFRRDSRFIQMLIREGVMTEEDVDKLFIFASTL